MAKPSFLIKTILSILALCLLLCGCGEGSNESASGKTEYTVKISSEGGLSLKGIGVYVYKDASLGSLVAASDTDKNGEFTFTAEESTEYVAVLKKLPNGYASEESYSVSKNTDIVLEIEMPQTADPMATYYTEGSIIHNFSVTAIDGKNYKLSELLKEKKAVVLNFWFVNCGPCKMEFPFMQDAYEQYSDKLEIIAINPVDNSESKLKQYAEDNGLGFPVALGDESWDYFFRYTGYPTTVVIDRYGMVAMIHTGAITNKETFINMFEYFTADDYSQAGNYKQIGE